MIFVGIVAAFLGFCFVVVALITILLRHSDTRLLRRLRAAPRLTCAELATGQRLPRSVLITARTAAGPDGRLRSPAYDTPCIWYETEVSSDSGDDRRMHLRLSAGDGSIRITDGTGSARLELRLAQQVGTGTRVTQVRSETASMSRHGEIGSGTGIARLQENGQLPDSVRPRLGDRNLDLTEVTIPESLEITVLARPRRTGHHEGVLLRRRGQVTPGNPEAWIGKLEADRVTSLWMIVIFPLIGAVLIAIGVALMWVGAT